jgi:hypothetical protein
MKNTISGIVIGIAIVVGGYFSIDFIKNIGNLNTSSLPSYSTKFDKTVNPHKDLKIAMNKAKKSGKNILIIAGGSWCKWCNAMDSFIDTNQDIKNKFYTDFEVVRVYYGANTNKYAQSLLKQFPVLAGTPHFYVLDSDAKLIKSFGTTQLEQGNSYNKTKFMDFIENHKAKTK